MVVPHPLYPPGSVLVLPQETDQYVTVLEAYLLGFETGVARRAYVHRVKDVLNHRVRHPVASFDDQVVEKIVQRLGGNKLHEPLDAR